MVNDSSLQDYNKLKKLRRISTHESLSYKRRLHLLGWAIHLFVKNGYEKVTVSDIAQACGWSKGLIYHYLDSKDDILRIIARDQAEGAIKGFGAIKVKCDKLSPEKALSKYINYFFGVVDKSQDYQIFLNQVAARLPREERKMLFDTEELARDILAEILQRGNKSGVFKVKSPQLMAQNILLLGRAWAERRWYFHDKFTIKQYTALQTKIINNAIKRTAGTAKTSNNKKYKRIPVSAP